MYEKITQNPIQNSKLKAFKKIRNIIKYKSVVQLQQMEPRIISHLGKQRKINIPVSCLLAYDIIFPGIQRELMEDHVQEIVRFQQQYFEKNGFYVFPNCLQFCNWKGQMYCIDGQHRYDALKKLYNNDRLFDWTIDIEITECANESEMIELFRIINMNKPVPEFLKTANETTIDLINGIRSYIKRVYGCYVKSSTKPQRPNINLDVFLDEMIKKYPLSQFKTLEIFMEWFETQNENQHAFLESMTQLEAIKKNLASIDLGTKTRSGKKFYLGCYWLDTVQNRVSAQTRHKCWRAFYSMVPDGDKSPEGDVMCPCCESALINQGCFEAGHIVSFKNGGSDEISNLRPVCSVCNKSMGIMNMDEYSKTLR